MNAPRPLQSLVLARPDRIGDVVITSSCLEPVRRALPGVGIHLLAQARMAPLFWKHPALHSFVSLPANENAAERRRRLSQQLRALNADCIIHLHSDAEVEWAANDAGIRRRIGFRERRGPWLTDAVPNTKKSGEKHEGFYNLDLLKLLGVPAPEKLVPNLAPEPAARERIRRKLPDVFESPKFAVLHLGAHGGKPRIAAEFFLAAARWLANQAGWKIVLLGDPCDRPRVQEIADGLGAPRAAVFSLIGQTDLAETAWLLHAAAIVFGRDSGPAHLAAAMGARTVTLMLEPEPENSARRWQPLGEHSLVLEKPLRRRFWESRAAFARRNLRQYRAGEIIEAFDRILKKEKNNC